MKMKRDNPMPNVGFRMMSVFLRLREPFRHPKERLVEAGVKRGQAVLDFGCGVGSYTIPAAQIVGEKGVVYGLDVHPLAIAAVDKRARKENLTNVKTILSGKDTGLPDESVDGVLLYDAFHLMPDKQALLKELHRVLKPDGFLSTDHEHMTRENCVEMLNVGNLFSIEAQGGNLFKCRKRET